MIIILLRIGLRMSVIVFRRVVIGHVWQGKVSVFRRISQDEKPFFLRLRQLGAKAKSVGGKFANHKQVACCGGIVLVFFVSCFLLF